MSPDSEAILKSFHVLKKRISDFKMAAERLDKCLVLVRDAVGPILLNPLIRPTAKNELKLLLSQVEEVIEAGKAQRAQLVFDQAKMQWFSKTLDAGFEALQELIEANYGHYPAKEIRAILQHGLS